MAKCPKDPIVQYGGGVGTGTARGALTKPTPRYSITEGVGTGTTQDALAGTLSTPTAKDATIGTDSGLTDEFTSIDATFKALKDRIRVTSWADASDDCVGAKVTITDAAATAPCAFDSRCGSGGGESSLTSSSLTPPTPALPTLQGRQTPLNSMISAPSCVAQSLTEDASGAQDSPSLDLCRRIPLLRIRGAGKNTTGTRKRSENRRIRDNKRRHMLSDSERETLSSHWTEDGIWGELFNSDVKNALSDKLKTVPDQRVRALLRTSSMKRNRVTCGVDKRSVIYD